MLQIQDNNNNLLLSPNDKLITCLICFQVYTQYACHWWDEAWIACQSMYIYCVMKFMFTYVLLVQATLLITLDNKKNKFNILWGDIHVGLHM